MISHIVKRELYSEYVNWAEYRCLGIISIHFYLSEQSTEAESDSDTIDRQVLKAYWWLVLQLYRTYTGYLNLKKIMSHISFSLIS